MTGIMPLLLYGKSLYCLPCAMANASYHIAAVYSTIGTICVLIAILTVDKMGRRTMFRECCMTPLSGTLILIAL